MHVYELLSESVSSITPLDAMNHPVCATVIGCLAILATVSAQTQIPPNGCAAGPPGRDGRDGRDGLPGPPGSPFLLGKQKGDSSFHLLITPDDVKNISYSNRIRLYESLSAGSSISFDAGSTTYNRLMRVTLVEPNVLKDSARYVVTATVSHRNPVSVTTDMDLTIAVSDNSSTVGYEIADQANSPTYMWASEGLSEQILNPSTTTFQSDEQNNYSPLHTVQVKFGGGVGAFGIGKTVSGVNRVAPHQYSKVLKPANGVYVDIYRNHAAERFIIDLIEVRLEKET